MAQDSIMGNLFGVSPAIYEQNKEEATRKQALEFSKLDPYERTNAMAFIGGRGLGNIVGGAIGAQDPVMMTLSKRAELGQKYDLTKPEGYESMSKELFALNDPQGADIALQRAKTLQESIGKSNLQAAQAGKAIAEADKIELDYSNEKIAKNTAKIALQAQNVDPSQIDAIVNNKEARTSYLKQIEEKTQTVEANGRVFLISKLDGTKIADLGAAPERGTKVSVDARQKQEDKFSERRGITQADALAETSNLARGGSLALGSIASMKEQDANGQLFTGPLANSYVGATNLLASVGLLSKEQTAKLTSSQIYDKSAKDLVMQDLGGKLGAQISDADRKFVEDRIPQLTTSQKARTELLNKLEEIQRGKIDYYQKMNAHANKFKNLNDFDFSEKYSGKLTAPSGTPSAGGWSIKPKQP